ncbi:MAG: cobalamin-dependent protein, partial [Candidatus Gribaldobacteria bacterium]|nr:cobalamin-dependent protein [Candidatus Gribaldobacteria bacterium]
MKIAISYPPIESDKGVPLLSQNRQFQYFHSPTYIYPMVPASAASLLKVNGYEVFWDDAIAEELSYQEWLARIIQEKPDIVAIETKTPVIKRHWQIIDQLKVQNSKCKVVLMGDHVTALPEESLKNSQVDFVLTGGDYDFMLLNLANHLAKAEALEPGWWFRDQNNAIQNTGPFQLKH